MTAQDDAGRSVVVDDQQLDPVTTAMLPDQEMNLIWAGDDPFRTPSDGAVPPAQGFYPPPGGFRFWYFTLPPDGIGAPGNLDHEGAIREVNEKLPGLLDVLEPDNPRMHTTDTVDVDLVVSGEAWLELDGGAEVHLHPGDCVVLNGNRHAWRNHSDQTAVIAVAIVGATRAAEA
ncbi:MAG: cupin domain-containing protein [Acidimicrobiales bacterium]